MTAINVKTKIRSQLVGFRNKLFVKNVNRDALFNPIFDQLKTELKVIDEGGKKKPNSMTDLGQT